MRVGAFWYPKAGGGYGFMRVRDVSFRESGVAAIRVYAGEAEEYTAFISREASLALKSYWRLRRRMGERIGQYSPVLAIHRGHQLPSGLKRYRKRNEQSSHQMASPITVNGIRIDFAKAWRASGVLNRASPGEFKSCHGFRKMFETEAKRAVGTRLGSWRGVEDRIASEDVKLLLGHHSQYHRPSLERLEEVYLALQPFLLIYVRREGLLRAKSGRSEGEVPTILALAQELSNQRSEVASLRRSIDALTLTLKTHQWLPLPDIRITNISRAVNN